MPTDPLELATGGFFHGLGIAASSRGVLVNAAQSAVPTAIRGRVVGTIQGQSAAGSVSATWLRPVSLQTGKHQILVFTGNEQAEAISQSHLRHKHTLELVVEVLGQAAEDHDQILEQLEAIARVVLVLVLNDQTLGGCADQVSYTGREWLRDGEEDARNVVQVLRLTFSVEYRTEYGLVVPDEFLQLGLGYDVDGDGVVDPGQGSGLDVEEVHLIQT